MRTKLVRLFALAMLLAPALPLSAAPLAEQLRTLGLEAPRERLPAPPFKLPTLDGTTVRLHDLRGQPVLIHFWATFCVPCRKEMPALQALADRFADRGLVVLAVAADRGNRSVVEAFVADHGLRLTVPLDADGRVRRQYEIDALPTTYLVGRDGRFLGRAIGERHWDGPAFHELFEQLTGR